MLSPELLVFSLPRNSLSLSCFIEIAFASSIVAKAYCQVTLLVQLSYDYQNNCDSFTLHVYLAVLLDSHCNLRLLLQELFLSQFY